MDKLERFAVMGNPISHSLSPQIHRQFAEQTGCKLSYEKILVEPAEFEQQVSDFFHSGGSGLNITLPFKERAYAMADVVTNRSEQAGAANTLWMDAGKLNADNTDGIGLIRDLSRYVVLTKKSILILGAGGAARGIIGALLSCNPKTLMIANRTLSKAQDLQQRFAKVRCCDLDAISGQYDIVINATSASTQQQLLTLPDKIMTNRPFCYDLAYGVDGKTSFVFWARDNGVMAKDGLGMLVEQAAEAFKLWHGVMPNTLDIQL